MSGPTMGRMTEQQRDFLLTGIRPNRVQHLLGQSHVEAWDVRRHLIRIFGFEGFTTETLSLDLVHERGEQRRKKDGTPYTAWTVVYRAQVRLTIRDREGRTITFFEDAAAGDSVNQPSIGDAHDMAMKTALSQALKRCAVNLGDQFGLSLYNDGSTDPVVHRSLAYMVAPEPLADDAPVRPEPAPVVEPSAPRNFVADAEQCTTADCAATVYREAQAAQVGDEVLSKIKAIGLQLRAVEQAGVGEESQDPHTAAVEALREFAAERGISDIDAAAYEALGAPLDDVAADAVWGFLKQLQTNR